MTRRWFGRGWLMLGAGALASTLAMPAWADGSSGATASASTTTTTASGPAKEDAVPNDGHFRWGISGMLGTFAPGPGTFALGLDLRFGYAFNQTVTVYGNLTAVAGIGVSSSSDGSTASVSAVSFWQIGPNIDALVAGPLFVGGGIGVGRAGWGVIKGSGDGSEVIAAGGFVPSIDGKIGLITGRLNQMTGKRSGFSIALDVRVLVAPGASDSTSSSNGASVNTTTTAIGVSPMLLLGYDLR